MCYLFIYRKETFFDSIRLNIVVEGERVNTVIPIFNVEVNPFSNEELIGKKCRYDICASIACNAINFKDEEKSVEYLLLDMCMCVKNMIITIFNEHMIDKNTFDELKSKIRELKYQIQYAVYLISEKKCRYGDIISFNKIMNEFERTLYVWYDSVRDLCLSIHSYLINQ
jgi:hypothetical protein